MAETSSLMYMWVI